MSEVNFHLNPLRIILRLHSSTELRKMLRELSGERVGKGKTHLELVRDVAEYTDISTLIEDYPDDVYARNTTLKLYRFLGDTGLAVESGIARIIGRFSDDKWEQLTSTGTNLRTISNEVKLLHVGQVEDKYYFLFVFSGRSKEVIDGLNVRMLPQPIFSIAVWDEATGYLQLRGRDPKDKILAQFKKWLKNIDNVEPSSNHIYVDSIEQFNRLKESLNGRARRGRFQSDSEEVEDITMVSQADVELFDTNKYQNLEAEYYTHSVGIDFVRDGHNYTVWVSFISGTVWVRSGEVDEEFIEYLNQKIFDSNE
jgi:hypothetical protein